MKIFIHLFILMALSAKLFAQGIGVNTTNTPADPSAMLDVDANNRGVLIPRLTTQERDAISNPAYGLMVINKDTDCINMWNGQYWTESCFDCSIQPPNVSSNSPICEGNTLNLTAATVSGATYSWTGPNGFSSNQQTPTIANATPAATGSYSLTVSVGLCVSSATSTSVVVNPIPVVTAGANSPVCTGDTLKLTATTISGASYSWTGPNGFTSSQQNPQITNIIPAIAGDYIVTSSTVGCPSSIDTVAVTYGTSQNGSQTFSYTGGVQTFTVPSCVYNITIDAYGAEGWSGNNLGGKGGRAQGTVAVTPGDVVYVYVGQQGPGVNSGLGQQAFNGGGRGYTWNSGFNTGAGGGASDIRIGGQSLNDRIIVAAGGGAATNNSGCTGGAGGGSTGGGTSCYSGTNGATQNAGGTANAGGASGTFGQGGDASSSQDGWVGGGGGGWYGGAAGNSHGSGSGGSSYLGGQGSYTTSNTSTTAGVRSGNGTVSISW